MRCNWKENLKHHCFLGPRLLYPTRPQTIAIRVYIPTLLAEVVGHQKDIEAVPNVKT